MTRFSVTAIAALAFASGAAADVTLNLGSFDLAANESAGPFSVDIADGDLTGIMISFRYAEAVSDFSWASDLGVDFSAPGGEMFRVGGLALADRDYNYAFQGSISDAPGPYSDNVVFASAGNGAQPASYAGAGTWSFTLTNTWGTDPNPTQWNEVVITLVGVNEVPAPGAVGLLGLAGIAAVRRRR